MSKQSNPGSGFRLSRREVLGGIAGTVVFAAGLEAVAKQVVKEIHELQPGEYTWHPERQPDGPVAVVVSIPEQRVHVYRNGVRIAASTCSTGKPGHSTPTGVFVVLQKDKHHHSSTYNNAPMPNMNRLTWSGIALHAGKLPGYPASHGCVRLPLEFSAKLFGVTHLGTPVIISGAHSDPWELIHPGMVLGAYAENEFETVVSGLEDKKHPSDWQESETYPVVSVIASSTDRKIEMIRAASCAANPMAASGGMCSCSRVLMPRPGACIGWRSPTETSLITSHPTMTCSDGCAPMRNSSRQCRKNCIRVWS